MNNKTTGTKAEQSVARWLEGEGYEIQERNYRCALGEIDLIARYDCLLVFFEVKYRKNKATGLPEEAVSPAKRKRICRVALDYLMMHGLSLGVSCRFDVIAVEGKEIRHYENAFPFMDAM